MPQEEDPREKEVSDQLPEEEQEEKVPGRRGEHPPEEPGEAPARAPRGRPATGDERSAG